MKRLDLEGGSKIVAKVKHCEASYQVALQSQVEQDIDSPHCCSTAKPISPSVEVEGSRSDLSSSRIGMLTRGLTFSCVKCLQWDARDTNFFAPFCFVPCSVPDVLQLRAQACAHPNSLEAALVGALEVYKETQDKETLLENLKCIA